MIQNDEPTIVIRKRIKMLRRQETTEKAFRQELECLDLFRFLRHKNIIELLGSYTHKDEHNILFPVLPMDLSAFLQANERFGDFIHNATFYSALSDLSSAVETVHNFFLDVPGRQDSISRIGYHHDIRPKNILVTRSTFILADFGLARFKATEENSKTGWKSGVGDYIAPECMDEEFNHQRIGRSIDIWSFGCLIMEIATYMQAGPPGVDHFRKERATRDEITKFTDHYFFERYGLKRSVEQVLHRLSKTQNDQGIRCLAKVAENLLQIEVDERPKAAAVSRMLESVDLRALYQMCRKLSDEIRNTLLQWTEKASPFHRIDIWFEGERLKAWGEILGMEADEIDCAWLRVHTSRALRLRSILERLHKLLLRFGGELNNLESSHDKQEYNSPPEAPVPQAHMSEELRRLVKDLWEAVPLPYQRRMEHAWR